MNTFIVHTTNGKRTSKVKVRADYAAIKDGVLALRNDRSRDSPYPRTVSLFAAGMWVRVDQLPEGN
jgi:hypothetical protein